MNEYQAIYNSLPLTNPIHIPTSIHIPKPKPEPKAPPQQSISKPLPKSQPVQTSKPSRPIVMRKHDHQGKNVVKAANYVIIAILAGSVLYLMYKISNIVIFVYDLNDKNEILMYTIWCIFIMMILYYNL